MTRTPRVETVASAESPSARYRTGPHKALLEATNAGHYFAECSCGWSGGVYFGRPAAREAHAAHRAGAAASASVKPAFLVGPPIAGQSHSEEETTT